MLLKILIAISILSIKVQAQNFRYLALGDSYTIGQSVDIEDRFPVQLYYQLRFAGWNIDYPEIIARTGWTTGDLLNAIKNNKPTGKFSFVTLLIGVNNQFQGGNLEEYREEFIALLEKAISYTDDPKKVIVLSIPDWGVTPFALQTGRNLNTISREINQFNIVNNEETKSFGCVYIDITNISREAKNDLSLLAADELHPSGKMYSHWVEKMLDTTKSILESTVVSITQQSSTLPKRIDLYQNYPNPFNPSTFIRYSISEYSEVIIKVFDILGNEITTLVNENQPQGNYKLEFDGLIYPSGIYFYRLHVNKTVKTKKMLLLK